MQDKVGGNEAELVGEMRTEQRLQSLRGWAGLERGPGGVSRVLTHPHLSSRWEKPRNAFMGQGSFTSLGQAHLFLKGSWGKGERCKERKHADGDAG